MPSLPALSRAAALVLALALSLIVAATPADAAYRGDNGLIAYASGGGRDGHVNFRSADGSNAQRVATNGVPVKKPVFSPSGRRIVFAGRGRLWTMYANGTLLRALTDGSVLAREPTWSPDGRWIAFTAGPAGARRIAVIRADGNELRYLPTGRGDDHSPAWSSRDDIAFVRRTPWGHDELYLNDPAGKKLRRLTHTKRNEREPAWSPNGRRLAFSAGRKGRRTVEALTIGARRPKRLAGPRRDPATPAFSPDGRRLAVTVRDGRHRQVWEMSARGGRLKRLSHSSGGAGAPDWQPLGSDPVIAAAGDVGCDPAEANYNGGFGTLRHCHGRYTSDILMTMDLSGILVLGDEQTNDGRPAAWDVFDATWGRLKPLLHPVPGNHEYANPDATTYFDYFNGVGNANGPAGLRGWGNYSFDIGSWHIVALNSQCSASPANRAGIDCSPGSPQETWLRQDLAAHPNKCTLAFWHHPLRSSGNPGENAAVLPFWQALYEAGADVVLNGHDHAYERLAPQDPFGNRDGVRGIRQFLVGTGGKSLQAQHWTAPWSEVRLSTFGVLQMTLGDDGYRWEFVNDYGETLDSGANSCH